MIGETFKNRYKVLKELGVGSSATVYEAADMQAGYRVAIKVLRPELSQNKRFVERFRREIRAAQLLRSELIVKVLDWGTQGGIYFIVFELVDGQTLRHLLDQRHQLPPNESVQLAIQMLNGVEEAHNAHIVHRDLKPENMMVTRAGVIKLMDFGIAKDGAMNSLTNDGAMIGTPYYISPEQATGSKVDARSDVYSIGAVIYEMLAGRPPFEADSPFAVVMKHTKEIPVALPQLNNEVPPQLDELVQKALQKDPTHRYQSAGEMAGALRRYLGLATYPTGYFVLPKAAGWFTQFLGPDTRPNRKGLIALLILGGLLFLIISIVIFAVVLGGNSGNLTVEAKGITPSFPQVNVSTTPRLSTTITSVSLLGGSTATASATNSPTAIRVVSATPTISSAELTFKEGVAAIASKDWKRAIQLFEGLVTSGGYNLTEVNERLKQSYCAYGQEQAPGGEIGETQTMLENCLKLDPENAEVKPLLEKVLLYHDGSIFASQKNWGAAFTPLEKLFGLDKNFRDVGSILYDAYLQYMGTLKNDKRYSEALTVCNKAKAIDVGGDPAGTEAECKKIQELSTPPTAIPVRTNPPSGNGSGPISQTTPPSKTGSSPTSPPRTTPPPPPPPPVQTTPPTPPPTICIVQNGQTICR